MTVRMRLVLVGWLVVLMAWTGDTAGQTGLVRIETPKPGGAVGEDAVEVGGTYPPKLQDDIWVLIWPEKAPKKFWPQSDNADQGLPATKQNGKWSVPCALGGPPQKYDVVVYTANRDASAVLSSTLRKWAASNMFPGMTRLPDGLTEQHRITIQKRR